MVVTLSRPAYLEGSGGWGGEGGREGGGKDEVKREGQRGKEEVGNLYLYLSTRSLSHLNDIAFVV